MRSFAKIKPSGNGEITLSFTIVGNPYNYKSRIFNVANMSLNDIRIAKISKLHMRMVNLKTHECITI